MSIFETLRRMQRLPRADRIAFLKSLVESEKPRSVRRSELEIALKREVTTQLRAETKQKVA